MLNQHLLSRVSRQLACLCTVLFSLSLEAANAIHFVGFNVFDKSNLKQSSALFDDYIHQLIPIAGKYGMEFGIYDVSHGGSAELDADVVTFGSVPDMDSFQAFFQDPEFAKISPMLHTALSGHQVIFTEGGFAPSPAEGHTLLSLVWLQGDPAKATKALDSIQAESLSAFNQYGVSLQSESVGVRSNKGLQQEILPTTPPHQMEIWSLRDAHGYLESAHAKAAHQKALHYISRAEDFWLKTRELR